MPLCKPDPIQGPLFFEQPLPLIPGLLGSIFMCSGCFSIINNKELTKITLITFPYFLTLRFPALVVGTRVVEDTIEYFCDQNQVSGELAWTVLECLATAKIAELKGELASA